MDGVDPETLLEWLQTGAGEERDLQLMALEQLCMLLLMSDNIDRCFESCPPRTFLPALGKIFLDETAPENILEVTARAITYYLDVSNECTRRITQVEGAVKAICNRLVVADLTDRTSKDLAEQCVKLLEHICQREASAVYDAGGLQSMLHLICLNDQNIHKDTMHSAMTVVTRLCSKVEPQDANLLKCSSDLGALLSHDDVKISECALRCFAALTDRFIRKQLDPVELATPSNLVEHLLNSLVPPSTLRAKKKSPSLQTGESQPSGGIHAGNRTPAFISIVLSLLSNLCRGSSAVTEQVIRSPLLVPAVKAVLSSKDERCVMDSLRLADLLIILLCEGRVALPKSSGAVAGAACSGSAESGASGFDKAHRHLIDAIRQRDTDALIDAVENGTVDPNFIDDVGQTLLNWCAAFGTSDMVIYLCDKGADPNKGQRSSSLHYAACFGRPEIVKILLQHGANPDLHDEEGRTALDKARERNDEGHQQVAQMLESPSSYMIETNNKVKPTAPANADNSGSSKPTTENNKTAGASDILSKIPTQPPENEVDMELAKRILQQLVPVFCAIFQNSLVGTVRRSTLALIRKCIFHISNEGIQQLLDDCNQRKLSTQRSLSPNTGNPLLDKSSSGDFVESLMGVLLAVFNQEDNQDTEGKEQALLVMKSLLQKDTEFWLEQLIRLGVYEKVESLANSVEVGLIQPTPLATSPLESPLESDALREHDNMSTISNQSLQSLSIGGLEDGMLSQTLSDSTTANRSEERSATSTPSLSIKSDVESLSSSFPHSRSTRESSNERLQMLNIPHMESDDTATAACSEINTPSPTVELEHNSSPQPTSSGINSAGTKVSSQFASVRADLVEAATAVAQALGVQIVDDSRSAITTGSSSSTGKSEKSRKSSDDAWKLVCGVSYKWNDWRLIRTKDSLFVWCDAVAIEFSDGSNGWLRFLLDGRLQTLYSSGSPESGADNSVNRGEFIIKIQKAKQAVPAGNQTKSIFTVPRSSRKIDSGNWQISCTEAGTLVIHNREGSQQKTIIKEDLPGFVFESKHSRQQFTAESTLGLDFVTGWAARGGGRRLRFRAQAQRQKIHDLAKELWEDYLKEAKTKPRDALIELQHSAAQIRRLVQQIQEEENESDGENTSVEWSSAVNELKKTLTEVRDAISNERLLSTFEVSISDVVPALLQLVKVALENGSKAIAKCFTETFSEARHLSYLIRKIVLVLEACERFPQNLYDTPGGSPFGMQLLTRRIRFRLEQANPEADSQKLFLNRSNRLMKAEPLATVGSLRQFLLGMMAKKWHDYARADLSFVREIKALKMKSEKLILEYDSDFDTNGLIWYLGTNGRSTDHWFNPALVRVVNVCCSDGAKQPYGQPEDIFSREVTSLNCHTSDSVDSNFTMDLGVLIFPSAYTLRHAQGYGRSALRNWLLQGSKDNHVWEMLLAHSDDQSLNEPGSTATWPIAIEPGQGPYRYLRVAQNGKNSSNITHYLSLSGFEVYGTVVDVIDTELKPLEAPPILQPASRSKSQHPTPITSSLAASSSSSKKQSRKSSTNSPGGFGKDAAHASSGAESKASTLSNLHYSRPPTAASLRLVRKQQKAEKAAALAAATAQIDTPPSSYGFGGQKGGAVHNEGLLLAAAATEDEIFKQLPGGANNNKLRILRYRRTGRTSLPISSTSSKPTPSLVKPDLLIDTNTTDPEEGSNNTPLASAENTPTPSSSQPAPSPADAITKSQYTLSNKPVSNLVQLQVGQRVQPSTDWTWSNQNNGGKGTVVGVSPAPVKKPLLGADSGWVDVQWDFDGSVNSYRYGHQGKFDVELVDDKSSEASAMAVLASYQRGKTLRQMRQPSGNHPSALAEQYFQEVPGKQERGSSKKSSEAVMESAMDQARAMLAMMNEGEVSIEVKNYNLTGSEESSGSSQQLLDLSEMVSKGLSSSTAQGSSISQQKSMSTTNLFDERQKPKGYTVASTNQAASAESLQHQTPSLENLLARSRIYGDRIPEVVGSDGEQTPSNATPEPRPFGSETVCPSSEKLDGSSQSMHTPTSNTIQTSVAASTFGGGSQPVLSMSSKHQGSHQLLGTSQSAVSLEKDHHHHHPGANPPKRSSNSKDLSASEPDLVDPSVPSARQQRQRSFVPASSLMEDPMLFMEEDEEEESEKADQPIIDEPEELSGVLVERAEPNVVLPKGRNTALSRTSTNSSASRFLSDIVDVECMDQFINSQEFYGGLVDAYSEMLMASGGEGGEVPENSQEVEQAFLSNYMGTALLQDLVSEGNAGSHSTPSAAQTALQELSSSTNNDDSVTSSSSSNAQSRRQLANLGMGLRLKLGNYADVLRGMMHQVMDSSGIIGSFDADELENEIYEDEFQAHQSLIENNCEGSDEVVSFEPALFPGANSRAAGAVGSGPAGMASASIAFQNQVESLASAAAALRRQFSNTSSGSATGSRTTAGLSNGSTTHLVAAEGVEPKLSWRQIFMGEEGRFEGAEGAGNNNGDDRANSGSRNFKKTARVWDDDFVLRRQLEALIPAFDPRPGRTNVNQTQEVELTNEPTESIPSVYTRKGSTMVRQSSLAAANASAKLRIYLKGPNLANIQDQTVELSNDDASIFYYIQELMNATEWGQKAAEKQKRVWEPTYTLIYENPDGENPISIQLSKPQLDNEAKENADGLVRQSLDLIQKLHTLADKSQIALPNEVFHSCKLTQKLTQSLTDPLIVCAKALPEWCNQLVFDYPCLFSVNTRSMHLHATAFGTSRAIVWLQNRRDQILDQNRSSSTSSAGSSNLAGSRREDHYPEYRIGRIKHERIKVHRNDDLLLENAIRVMNFHAIRKSVLEIEYFGEEGTGLGPTLEFYALVAAEFQRKSLTMWLCDDLDEQQTQLEAHELDLGEGAKPPGYYVRRIGGLFPAFLPQGTEETKKVSSLFRIFGIFLAKVMQDNRLVDIPLSTTFLRLMLSPEITKSGHSPNSYFSPLNTVDDLAQIHPLKANFLRSLQKFIQQKQAIKTDSKLTDSAKKEAIAGLKLKLGEQDHRECSVDDLALSFVLNPPSSIFAYKEIELVEQGSKVDVTVDNVEEYVEKCLDFYLNTGIREQVTAFRQGFDLVFPLSSLTAFTPSEVQVLLSGEQCPQWTRDDIMKYTEPKLGYSRDSAGFLHFVDVLVDMNAAERKGFLQFTTGCSSLPPGGLANLHPRLTVVRKVGSGDGSFPSVNTCVHYLKLPEYSSAEILRERLLAATYEKGFHLN